MIPIYTIGYGNRSIEEFIALLQRYDIQYLVDIRSQPYSRFSPDFSQKALQQHLKQHNIGYLFMGKELGGRPKESALYKDDGKVVYEKLAQSEEYKQGIARLHDAWTKQLRVVLMCSELKPTMCHRGKLVGKTLSKQGVEIMHIDEQGEMKTQDEVNRDLAGGHALYKETLFEEMGISLNDEVGFSRKKYASGEEEEDS